MINFITLNNRTMKAIIGILSISAFLTSLSTDDIKVSALFNIIGFIFLFILFRKQLLKQ